MKGLLLKDWYMARKYCKSYLVIAVVFIAISIFSDDNMFFVFYPCLLCGMIPVNLLGYDERSRWLQYSCTLPYTRAQLVSAKYLIGLFAQLVTAAAIGITYFIKMTVKGNFVLSEFLFMMLMLLTVSTLTSSISLPFMFKLGVEKGRAAYYVMIGFVCGASILASGVFMSSSPLEAEAEPNIIMAVVAAVGIAVYAFSWYLSIVFFKKREIQ